MVSSGSQTKIRDESILLSVALLKSFFSKINEQKKKEGSQTFSLLMFFLLGLIRKNQGERGTKLLSSLSDTDWSPTGSELVGDLFDDHSGVTFILFPIHHIGSFSFVSLHCYCFNSIENPNTGRGKLAVHTSVSILDEARSEKEKKNLVGGEEIPSFFFRFLFLFLLNDIEKQANTCNGPLSCRCLASEEEANDEARSSCLGLVHGALVLVLSVDLVEGQ